MLMGRFMSGRYEAQPVKPLCSAIAGHSRYTLFMRGVFLLALSCVLAYAQGVHPITGRQYAGVMSADGAPWLTRPEREEEEHPDQALHDIGIVKGSTVAD